MHRDARRRHQAGRDHIHRDPVVGDFGGESGGETLQRRLAHAVDRAAAAGVLVGRLGMDAGARRDVDDPARSPLAHRRQHQLRQVEGRIDLHFHHQLEALLGEVRDRDEVGDGGVVHQDVDRAVGGRGLLDQPLALGRLRQVGLDQHRLAAGLADARDGVDERAGEPALAVFRRAGRDHDLGALYGEPRADGLADPAAGAGDQGDLSPQRSVRIDPSLRHPSLPLKIDCWPNAPRLAPLRRRCKVRSIADGALDMDL